MEQMSTQVCCLAKALCKLGAALAVPSVGQARHSLSSQDENLDRQCGPQEQLAQALLGMFCSVVPDIEVLQSWGFSYVSLAQLSVKELVLYSSYYACKHHVLVHGIGAPC